MSSIPAKGYVAKAAGALLEPFKFKRRSVNADDVAINILFCGVCHSDLFTVRGTFGWTQFPCVPGHEIVGRVRQVGAAVTRFKEGDVVAVGSMVDSCRSCTPCRSGLEPYCERGFTQTYNSPDRFSGGLTFGGYSDLIVVREEFVFRIANARRDSAPVAPLLCAGITTWSPLRHWKVGPGKRIGIVGIGGLGHMGIRLAKALGAQVVAFTTSSGKKADALRLGANEVVLSSDAGEMSRQANSLDFILNTVAVPHDLDAFLGVAPAGRNHDARRRPLGAASFTLGGQPDFQAPRARGHAYWGLIETQEMLDFCAERNIVADVEIIAMPQINDAYARMNKNDVKYRFVMDIASIGT